MQERIEDMVPEEEPPPPAVRTPSPRIVEMSDTESEWHLRGDRPLPGIGDHPAVGVQPVEDPPALDVQAGLTYEQIRQQQRVVCAAGSEGSGDTEDLLHEASYSTGLVDVVPPLDLSALSRAGSELLTPTGSDQGTLRDEVDVGAGGDAGITLDRGHRPETAFGIRVDPEVAESRPDLSDVTDHRTELSLDRGDRSLDRGDCLLDRGDRSLDRGDRLLDRRDEVLERDATSFEREMFGDLDESGATWLQGEHDDSLMLGLRDTLDDSGPRLDDTRPRLDETMPRELSVDSPVSGDQVYHDFIVKHEYIISVEWLTLVDNTA